MKKLLFYLVFLISLLFLTLTSCSNKNGTVENAFKALSKGDAKLFYSYLDVREGGFITPEQFEEAFSSYKIPSEYTISKKSDLVWTASYDGGSRNIMLTEDKNNVDFFPYIDDDVTIRVPKGAKITVDEVEFNLPSSVENIGYDEYNIGPAFLYSLLSVSITGEVTEDAKALVTVENTPINLTDCNLKDGVDKSIINTAATFVMALYYSAQREEATLPLENYLFSSLPTTDKFAIETLFEEIKNKFAFYDGVGNLKTEGIWDLNFSSFFGNVTKNENGTYTANVTLSYSYVTKTFNGTSEVVFDDVTVAVGTVFDKGQWSIVSLENAIID